MLYMRVNVCDTFCRIVRNSHFPSLQTRKVYFLILSLLLPSSSSPSLLHIRFVRSYAKAQIDDLI